ncbi:MAG: ChaN family lipoprotein [Bacteroidia bacterium]|jgi:uncharacterized iron-regulated protein
MKKTLILLLLMATGVSLQAQNLSPYTIYNAKGKEISYSKMMATLSKQDIILFGELHNSALAHWLQVEVTKELATKRALQLGAEMLEADDQNAVNLYLSDSIDQKGLDTLARLWPNYTTDYAPLVNYAKENKLEFIATNIPRRYARLVNKGGFEALDTLPAIEKSYVAPLPIAFDAELPTYKSILEMMGEHGTPSLVKAQASKDATMAHFILKNYKTGKLFIHYNGAFHSDYYEGIGWYLKRQSPTLNYSTISTVTQADITKLNAEHIGKADFILVIDEDVTTTY